MALFMVAYHCQNVEKADRDELFLHGIQGPFITFVIKIRECARYTVLDDVASIVGDAWRHEDEADITAFTEAVGKASFLVILYLDQHMGNDE